MTPDIAPDASGVGWHQTSSGCAFPDCTETGTETCIANLRFGDSPYWDCTLRLCAAHHQQMTKPAITGSITFTD